jgi:putative holliday junction resolvase
MTALLITTPFPDDALHDILKNNPADPIHPSPSPHPALGVDYGDSRIGIAATDDFGIMAHPVETVATEGKDPLGRIAEIAAMRKIRTLVVGLPLRLDGSEGDSAKKVRKFAKTLANTLPAIPMVFVDETYTTADATEKLREAGHKAKHQKHLIDQAAAVEILNRWMGEIL